jgi:Ion transport protein
MTNVVKGRLTAYERVLGSVAKPLEKANQEEEKEVEAPEQNRKEIFFEALESVKKCLPSEIWWNEKNGFGNLIFFLLSAHPQSSFRFHCFDGRHIQHDCPDPLDIARICCANVIFLPGPRLFLLGHLHGGSHSQNRRPGQKVLWERLEYFGFFHFGHIPAGLYCRFPLVVHASRRWIFFPHPSHIPCHESIASVANAEVSEYFNLRPFFPFFRLWIKTIRPVRTITLLENLQVIVNTVLQSISSMTIIFCLMLLFLYMFAVMGRQLYSEASQYYFGDLFKAITTMFQVRW